MTKLASTRVPCVAGGEALGRLTRHFQSYR